MLVSGECTSPRTIYISREAITRLCKDNLAQLLPQWSLSADCASVDSKLNGQMNEIWNRRHHGDWMGEACDWLNANRKHANFA